MVSTSELFNENNIMSHGTSATVRNTGARKPIYLFTEVLDANKETAALRVGAAKSNRKSIIGGSML